MMLSAVAEHSLLAFIKFYNKYYKFTYEDNEPKEKTLNIYLTPEFNEKLTEFMDSSGIDNFSKLFTEAVLLFIA